MKTLHTYAVLGLLGLAGLSTGCTSVNTVERAESMATPNYVADKRVITDKTLASTVRVLSVNQSTVSGNLLKIQVMVQNTRNTARPFNYKFEWYDKDGMLVETPSSTWKAQRIEAKETIAISAVAVKPTAVDFVLKIQEPK